MFINTFFNFTHQLTSVEGNTDGCTLYKQFFSRKRPVIHDRVNFLFPISLIMYDHSILFKNAEFSIVIKSLFFLTIYSKLH